MEVIDAGPLYREWLCPRCSHKAVRHYRTEPRTSYRMSCPKCGPSRAERERDLQVSLHALWVSR